MSLTANLTNASEVGARLDLEALLSHVISHDAALTIQASSA